MAKRWVLPALFVLFAVAAAHGDTGGSMGGGDWSSSSSGGGYSSSGGGYSSSSSGGGWTSSSSNDYTYSSSGGGSGGDLSPAWFILLLVVGVGYVWISAVIQQNRDPSPSMSLGLGSYSPAIDSVDVSVLRIVLDGRSRKFVQSELARIGKLADTSTKEGRSTMLREVAMLLRRLRDAWVYGGARNEPMRDLGNAKPVFDGYVDDARARFKEETIRNEQGQTTRTAPSSYTPRSDEGAGLILVSIVIAARRELFTVSKIGDGDDLRHALEAASQLSPQELVAIEIVWMPSEDEDRLSSMELEAKYPRPELIPIANALVGKTFCTYCGGPFPAELVSCPHCGAPAPGREKKAA